ncbi:MAG: glucose-1-phosphate thymidylyltransferase RfbA [Candidatus Omnitrophica bacterium]|jgi:glucose-1-phosphate thymidylyltransferase|nr:glucose-1-phosphate thymidylyltransferase RfbA [Candidatus Omnitrophota bacterium]
MKGIILAGGNATRLYPVTKGVCKQMLPVYDKPLIYYPLSILMLAGIRKILIISTPKDLPRFKDLLGNGNNLGLEFSYAIQDKPRGIAEAFIVGEKFIGRDKVSLILGDNIFYGHDIVSLLQQAKQDLENDKGGIVFGYYVKDPQRYGVIEFDKNSQILSLKEKPQKPKSNWVVTGLYFYDNQVVDIAKKIKPSKRGELEITDINNIYLKNNRLKVKLLGRGYAWLDTGTYDSLLEAALFVKAIEDRQGLKIGCIEEISYRMGYIKPKDLKKIADSVNTSYGQYLKNLLNNE